MGSGGRGLDRPCAGRSEQSGALRAARQTADRRSGEDGGREAVGERTASTEGEAASTQGRQAAHIAPSFILDLVECEWGAGCGKPGVAPQRFSASLGAHGARTLLMQLSRGVRGAGCFGCGGGRLRENGSIRGARLLLSFALRGRRRLLAGLSRGGLFLSARKEELVQEVVFGFKEASHEAQLGLLDGGVHIFEP